MDELCELMNDNLLFDSDEEVELLMYSKSKTLEELANQEFIASSYKRFCRYERYIRFDNNKIYHLIESYKNIKSDTLLNLAQKAKTIDFYIIEELLKE